MLPPLVVLQHFYCLPPLGILQQFLIIHYTTPPASCRAFQSQHQQQLLPQGGPAGGIPPGADYPRAPREHRAVLCLDRPEQQRPPSVADSQSFEGMESSASVTGLGELDPGALLDRDLEYRRKLWKVSGSEHGSVPSSCNSKDKARGRHHCFTNDSGIKLCATGATMMMVSKSLILSDDVLDGLLDFCDSCH
ncbi:hypothetical protein U0070_011527 [Myodes glareolus]|uniref:Uncharacterized protein n=1 Tax=Myodes glareolus TaxID=447135 RepID=A0AAW0H8J7_MYOGA